MPAPLARLTPISQLSTGRPQEHGKCKTGIKVAVNGKPDKLRPTSIDTFRFVSTDETAIRQLAADYGIARVQAVPSAPKGQVYVDELGKFDVVTEAKEIDIILTDDPLGGTPLYEQWKGGARCVRRCSAVPPGEPGAETCCSVLFEEETQGGTDSWRQDMPCQCIANQVRECNPTTRMSMILPNVRLAGVWAYSSKSWDVAREFQQMLTILQAAQARGLTRAKMRLEQRHRPGKNYTVPVLVFDGTLTELMAGAGTLVPQLDAPVMLEARDQPALPAAPGPLDLERQRIAEMWAKLSEADKVEATEKFPKEMRESAGMDQLMEMDNWLRSKGVWAARDEAEF